MVRRGRVIIDGMMGWRELERTVMKKEGVGWGGEGGTAVVYGRRGYGASGGGWGSAAGAVRIFLWRANAWRACGVEGGDSHRKIFSQRKALLRDRLCPFTLPISRRTSRPLEYIEKPSLAPYALRPLFGLRPTSRRI